MIIKNREAQILEVNGMVNQSLKEINKQKKLVVKQKKRTRNTIWGLVATGVGAFLVGVSIR